jgi:hypothetical protein
MTQFSDPVWITAADISPNGNEILVRRYPSAAASLFVRPAGGTIADAFNTTPISLSLHSETQGEAIGFDPRGWGFYTTSEGANQPIYYYDRLPHGDWDHNGAVQAADYVAWRKGLGTIYQAGDYNTWRANYGASAPGAGAGADFVAVPEPGVCSLLVVGVATILLRMPRSFR